MIALWVIQTARLVIQVEFAGHRTVNICDLSLNIEHNIGSKPKENPQPIQSELLLF